eukprot:366182-Chlamydomonas_euryale.AAC.1
MHKHGRTNIQGPADLTPAALPIASSSPKAVAPPAAAASYAAASDMARNHLDFVRLLQYASPGAESGASQGLMVCHASQHLVSSAPAAPLVQQRSTLKQGAHG